MLHRQFIWMRTLLLSLCANCALAGTTCVTDTTTGSSSTTSDCATCKALGGCCYTSAGDCGTPKPKFIFVDADFFDTGSTGTGSGTVAVDIFAGQIFFDLSIDGLIGMEPVIEIMGPYGSGGDGVLLYTLPPGPLSSGVLTMTDIEACTLEQQRIDIASGLWWIRVRTTMYPQGEIGGSLAFSSSLCAGDANVDGVVNFADVTQVLLWFGESTFLGDANHDGFVDFADVAAVLASYATECLAE